MPLLPSQSSNSFLFLFPSASHLLHYSCRFLPLLLVVPLLWPTCSLLNFKHPLICINELFSTPKKHQQKIKIGIRGKQGNENEKQSERRDKKLLCMRKFFKCKALCWRKARRGRGRMGLNGT